MWPKYLEDTEENRNISPPPHAFYYPSPSSTPVELREESPRQSEQELLKDDLSELTQVHYNDTYLQGTFLGATVYTHWPFSQVHQGCPAYNNA